MAWTCLVRKVWYFMAYFRAPSKIWQSPTEARIFSRHPFTYSQDQVCDSNHAECVLFSQSLVPRRNTKAYFLHHNTGCCQLWNNPDNPDGCNYLLLSGILCVNYSTIDLPDVCLSDVRTYVDKHRPRIRRHRRPSAYYARIRARHSIPR